MRRRHGTRALRGGALRHPRRGHPPRPVKLHSTHEPQSVETWERCATLRLGPDHRRVRQKWLQRNERAELIKTSHKRRFSWDLKLITRTARVNVDAARRIVGVRNECEDERLSRFHAREGASEVALEINSGPRSLALELFARVDTSSSPGRAEVRTIRCRFISSPPDSSSPSPSFS